MAGIKSSVETGLYQVEIDAAIKGGRSKRDIARTFNLSPSAVQRRRNQLKAAGEIEAPSEPPAPSPAPSGQAQVLSGPSGPSGPREARPSRSTGPRRSTGENLHRINRDQSAEDAAEPFDLQRLSYPWRNGEVPAWDATALQLRERQARGGPDAIRRPLLDLVMDYSRTHDDDTIARRLNVPVEMIASWRGIRLAEMVGQHTAADPSQIMVEEIAELEQAKRPFLRTINDPRSTPAQLAIASEKVLKINREIRKLKEQYGAIRQVPHREHVDHDMEAFRQGITEMCKAFMEARQVLDDAGIDPNFPTTPEGIATALADYDDFKAELPDTRLPEFMEDDPYGWRPTQQRSRLIRARKLAAGRKDHYGHQPGDLEPIPGVDYLPSDVSQVAEYLRLCEERRELGLDPTSPPGPDRDDTEADR